MKKLLINDYDIPIDYLFDEAARSAIQIQECTKEMNSFSKKIIELKEKYPEREFLVNSDDREFKDIYCGKNKDKIYFKYDRKCYEDSEKTTKLVYVNNDDGYQALIKDKKSNKMFVIQNDSRSCHIYFYENDILKRILAISLYSHRKELVEFDINFLGFYANVTKRCSNKLNFESETSILKSIEKDLSKKSSYEIIFNKGKTDLKAITLVNGKVKDFSLNAEAMEKLTPNLREKMRSKTEKTFEEIAGYLKEKEELAFLSNDKEILYTDLKSLLEKVKSTINKKQNCFYNYNHQAFKIIDVVAEDILGKPCDLQKEEEIDQKKIKYKGLVLTDYEGYDYKKLTYEQFNFENINLIFDAISKEIELSGHDEKESIEIK